MKRVHAVDLIRGGIMMLMALDHARVYSGIAASSPEPAVFLTRWITNFCAPTFFLLAGVSAWLSMQERGRGSTARMFLVRGLWLVALEFTVIRMSWTFKWGCDGYLLGGVIWSLGCSMILMSALIWLRRAALVCVSLLVITSHNALAAVFMTGSPWREDYPWAWRLIYTGGVIEGGAVGGQFLVLYSIVPWVAVMAAGFAFGPVLRMEESHRNRVCVRLGLGMIVAFLLLRSTGVYGDPNPWSTFPPDWPGWVAFLNTNKYPASLSFLLMTLGPVILAIPWLERARGAVARVIGTLGKVPLFFYLLHIPLIHALAILLASVRSPGAIVWLLGGHPLPMERPPDGYAFGLPLLYCFTVVVLVLAYWICRWFAALRRQLPLGLGRLL